MLSFATSTVTSVNSFKSNANETSPLVPPPLNPLPAVTPVISPLPPPEKYVDKSVTATCFQFHYTFNT